MGSSVIVASDEVVAKVPPDVNIDFIQTGYLHLEQPDEDDPELEAFLSKGPPPIYSGFGSMPKKDQAANIPMIVTAAREAGQRIVIAKFWDEPSEFSQSDDVFFIKKYPHLKLFPRMAAVIHHGGAGTTATSAVSGVPQIIVPHILDQYFWGHQVYISNLGPKPIWRSKLNAKRLTAAINECISNNLIKKSAKQAANTIEMKKCLERVVQYIESV